MSVLNTRQQQALAQLTPIASTHLPDWEQVPQQEHHWVIDKHQNGGVTAVLVDGEHIIVALIDPYGHTSASFGAGITWVHDDGNQDCECDVCAQERQQGQDHV